MRGLLEKRFGLRKNSQSRSQRSRHFGNFRRITRLGPWVRETRECIRIRSDV